MLLWMECWKLFEDIHYGNSHNAWNLDFRLLLETGFRVQNKVRYDWREINRSYKSLRLYIYDLFLYLRSNECFLDWDDLSNLNLDFLLCVWVCFKNKNNYTCDWYMLRFWTHHFCCSNFTLILHVNGNLYGGRGNNTKICHDWTL